QEAYQHPHEYFFGAEMLVAPVLDASGNRTVYLPPGRWLDFFTGKAHDGAGTFTAHYAVDQTPVFVREGSIIPGQPADMAWSDARPLRSHADDLCHCPRRLPPAGDRTVERFVRWSGTGAFVRIAHPRPAPAA